ncbi:MAG TPA: 50S ribosomal protein L27, partial [Thermoleophilaceae bacterium]|nr:50S ribosomal protein L27 [Thermoleophilaceae bacterium]
VPAAMVRAYSAAAGGGFAQRLLAALEAAEGEGVGIGRDDTIFATRPGTVQFAAGRRGRLISVEPAE